jgi:hypothetical protein
MGQQQVVRGPYRVLKVLLARRMDASVVAQVRRAPGLVKGNPVLDPIPQVLGYQVGIFGESVGRLPARPAALVFQGLGQIPVVEGGPGGNTLFQEGIHQPVVKVQAPGVHPPPALGQDARPGHREAVGVHPQLFHQGDVLWIAVVVIAGHIPVVAAFNFSGGMAEGIPDAGPPSVFGYRALNLIGRGRRAPDEVGGEIASFHRSPQGCCRVRWRAKYAGLGW